MRLITAEDYAALAGIELRTVYQMIQDNELSSYDKLNQKRITLVFAENVPESIPSLDPDIEYMTQKSMIAKLEWTANRLREKIKSGEIKSVVIKGFCFIPKTEIEVAKAMESE